METVPSWPMTQMTSSAVQRAMSLPLCVAGSDASSPQGKSHERMRVWPLRSRALENEEHGVPRWRYSLRRCRSAARAPEFQRNSVEWSGSSALLMMSFTISTPAFVERSAHR